MEEGVKKFWLMASCVAVLGLLMSPEVYGAEDGAERFSQEHLIAEERLGSDYLNFYQGRHRAPLTMVEFLQIVGEEDLAETAERRVRRGRIMGYTSAGLGIVGLAALWVGVVMTFGDDPEREELGGTIGMIGGGMMLTGGVLYLFSDPKVDGLIAPHEARRRVDEYNRDLRRDLGLDGEERPREQNSGGMEDLRVRLAPLDGGAALGVSFRF